jgi:hypothetical protein
MVKILVLVGFTACAGFAGTVTYTFSATASGTLDGTPFSDSLLTITALADTSTPGSPFSSTVVVGATSDTFNLQTTFVFFNPSCGDFAGTPCVGFELSSGDVLDIPSPSLAGYVLGTSIGPINTASLTGEPFDPSSDDSGGTLNLTAASNGSFTASTSAAVPEPAGLALVASGLTVLGFVRRRKAS